MENSDSGRPRRKIRISTILLFLVLGTGLCLMAYPAVSDLWNSARQTRAIAAYTEEIQGLDSERYEMLWSEAQEYNRKLLTGEVSTVPTEEDYEAYQSLLNVSGNGMMGYVEIPSIHCTLPVYHGTDEAVLQIAAGHMEGMSLPVGGEGTHCVLSSHRGLPSARLFTDLDQLKEGDEFFLHVLGKTLAYEVNQILVVEPDETEALAIEEGQDYCTLVTCTPYGVNSHRLLVRGSRAPYEGEALVGGDSFSEDAKALSAAAVLLPAGAVLFLAALLIRILFGKRAAKRNRK